MIVSISRGISILICSYNGASRLPEVLKHIASQKIAGNIALEIIVVDNCSVDETGKVAQDIWNKLNVPAIVFQVIYENKPGKNNAIDTGLEAAKYSYVLICDDDNWLEENYLQIAYEIMESNPIIGMLGGKGIAAFESEPPDWFEYYKNYYAVGSQNKSSGELNSIKGFLWGAGSVINKNAYLQLKQAGFERMLTFESFPSLARGEDIELCLAIKLIGFKLWYDERLLFWHFISKDKLNWQYIIKLTKEGNMMVPFLGIYKTVMNGYYSNQYPPKGIWLKKILRNFADWQVLSSFLYVFFKTQQEGNKAYLDKVASLYTKIGYLVINSKYEKFLKRTILLHKKTRLLLL